MNIKTTALLMATVCTFNYGSKYYKCDKKHPNNIKHTCTFKKNRGNHSLKMGVNQYSTDFITIARHAPTRVKHRVIR